MAGSVGRNNYAGINEIVDFSYFFQGNVSDMVVQFMPSIYAKDLHDVFNFSVPKKQLAKLLDLDN